jgi:hypothetical protein
MPFISFEIVSGEIVLFLCNIGDHIEKCRVILMFCFSHDSESLSGSKYLSQERICFHFLRGLRFFSVLPSYVTETKFKAYFQCSSCPNDIHLLIPMKKVLKVENVIDSINEFKLKLEHTSAQNKFLLLMYEIFLSSEDILYRKITDRNLSIELRRDLLNNTTILTLEDAILLNLIVPEHMLIPTSYTNGKWNYSFASAVEEELVTCGRSAYADTKSVVDMEHRYLAKQYPWIKLSLSKEEI